VIGSQERWQEDLFVAGPLSSLIPDDHILKRVDKVLDLSWLRSEVEDCYSETMGRPSIDTESALRLMLAGYFQGIVHDRKLMREAQVNLAIRWFAGFRLHETLPEHSSLTKIRQRWGPQKFKKIFQKTVQMCIDAGLVNGETVHIDSTLIRADVSWESLTTEYADKAFKENCLEDENNSQVSRTGKPKKRSTTDPDATMTTSCRQYRMEPCFKQHTAVDDGYGVILDVETTTGEVSEGKELLRQLSRIEQATGNKVQAVTADAAYAHNENYAALEKRGIEAIIPPQCERKSPQRIPINRFKYDGKHQIVRCPTGKILKRSFQTSKGWIYKAAVKDCADCLLRERCVSPTAKSRTVLICPGYESLLRVRRRYRMRDDDFVNAYQRHRWRVEGIHGEAKTQHGLRRAVRRGLANVSVQVYLTAAVMNLKRLVAFLCLLFIRLEYEKRRWGVLGLMESAFNRILLRWQKYFIVLKMAD
jgi:transposase